MNRKIKSIVSILCGAVMCTCVAPLTACGHDDASDECIVVYNLNYDGVSNRSVSIPVGASVVSWQPNRDGYNLLGWYTDENCTRKFDFAKKAGDDITLYAKWQKQSDKAVITFDANFAGKYSDTVAVADVGGYIDESLAPSVNRLGYKFTRWYVDEQCETEWDFNSKVTGDTTLYAGYVRDNSVKRDAEGNPVFENITVNVWLASGFNNNDNVIWNLAKAFNNDEAYKGKIKINVTTNLTSQDFFSLRFQRTTSKNETDDMYYSVGEVYELAGIEFSESDWYENASKESRVAGRLSSVPVAACVPYMIYNKTLMQKYNGDNDLPSNYTEFSTLLKKVYDGEIGTNKNFTTIVTGSAWSYTDWVSSAAFLQNGADYFNYENGKFLNKWSAENGGIENAATALANMYSYFGASGNNKGLLGPSESGDDIARKRVIAGDSLMGIVNYPQTIIDLCNNKNIGVVPLSGLYADGEQKDKIPVSTLGLSFYKAGGLNNTALAAAAVFADYVSKNSYLFAQNGFYPLNKAVVESSKFQNSDNDIVAFLRKVGNPENFHTLDGHINTCLFVSDIASKQYILPMLRSTDVDTDMLADRMSASMKSI